MNSKSARLRCLRQRMRSRSYGLRWKPTVPARKPGSISRSRAVSTRCATAADIPYPTPLSALTSFITLPRTRICAHVVWRATCRMSSAGASPSWGRMEGALSSPSPTVCASLIGATTARRCSRHVSHWLSCPPPTQTSPIVWPRDSTIRLLSTKSCATPRLLPAALRW